jgi:hypothetical protein
VCARCDPHPAIAYSHPSPEDRNTYASTFTHSDLYTNANTNTSADSDIWSGEKIIINKNEMEKMGTSVKNTYIFDMGYVYSEETGKKAAVFTLEPLSPLIYGIRIIGYWANYNIDEFSVTQFSVTKETEEEKEKPALFLELEVDPNKPEANPPFITSQEKKSSTREMILNILKKFKNYKINLYSVDFISIFIIIFICKSQ